MTTYWKETALTVVVVAAVLAGCGLGRPLSERKMREVFEASPFCIKFEDGFYYNISGSCLHHVTPGMWAEL